MHRFGAVQLPGELDVLATIVIGVAVLMTYLFNSQAHLATEPRRSDACTKRGDRCVEIDSLAKKNPTRRKERSRCP